MCMWLCVCVPLLTVNRILHIPNSYQRQHSVTAYCLLSHTLSQLVSQSVYLSPLPPSRRAEVIDWTPFACFPVCGSLWPVFDAFSLMLTLTWMVIFDAVKVHSHTHTYTLTQILIFIGTKKYENGCVCMVSHHKCIVFQPLIADGW